MTRPLVTAASLLAATIALGLVGRAPLAFDALGAFRLHLAALAALGALAALLLRRRAAALAFGLAAILGVAVTPVAFAPERRAPASGPVLPLTLLSANVHHDNPDLAALAEALAAPAADVLVTLETPPALLAEPALAPWPHRHGTLPPKPPHGAMIWSRRPFLAPDPEARAGGNPRHAIARLPLPEGPPLRIAAFHVSRPLNGGQADELADFHRFWPRLAPPIVVAGDFNAAPWSWTIRQIERISRSRVLGGVRPSWAGPFGLPIDHVLVSDGIGAEAVETLPIPGSDHRAVLARLLIPREGP